MDINRSVIFNDRLPLSMFGETDAAWVEIPVSNIEVKGEFYVHAYKKWQPFVWALLVASDNSIPNEHSGITVIQPNKVDTTSWPYESIDKSKVNWMIRIVGTYVEQ